MIVVKVEHWPNTDPTGKREAARLFIRLTGTTTQQETVWNDYEIELQVPTLIGGSAYEMVTRKDRIIRWPKHRSTLALVAEALRIFGRNL